MATLTGNQIRKIFLDYFVKNGHTLVKSSSLIPQNDPTLYFTNAGMVQFKNTFTGQEKRNYIRATTSQKCMRVSGKHNDLENVGRTARHHTFFEMLGNFSFGDYFKSDAIPFAWKFLTEEIKLPKEKLWITIYNDDDEAFEIWNKKVGIASDRIKRLGEKDNFWSMGDTGPCGPCSEIHYEQDIPCSLKNPNCALGACDCDKFLEIWNLVFMQFERQPDGKLLPLPKPSIDTGMGLERLTALLQGKNSNYDCDLFTPLLAEIQALVGKKYGADSENDVSMRVLADHIRATVFLISDGVLPSNEGRGYVLRRIMRRAIRHGKLLGQVKPFFYKLTDIVVAEMAEAYPELKTNQVTIEKVIHAEEERFLETLDTGLRILSTVVALSKDEGKSIISGSDAFKLYDTYGFPFDLTELIAAEHKMTVDQIGFEKCMTEQKERARSAWKGSGESSVEGLYLQLGEKLSTKFLGYETLEATGKVIAIVQDGKSVTEASAGACSLIFDETPFYGEGGGQSGDKGRAKSERFEAVIEDTQKPVPHLFAHHAKIKNGSVKVGDTIQLTVDRAVRKPTMRNHTATHILHAALRKILGTHVRQAGSMVTDKMLRFDFSHFEGIAPLTLRQIEDEVNRVILSDLGVDKSEMDHESAIKKGALAFFGDKYGDRVRVISVGDYSVELCGGTHLDRASEIGFFRIISESSIAAGVRRIEAITGHQAYQLAYDDSDSVQQIAAQFKSQPNEIVDKVDKLRGRVKTLEKEIEKLKSQLLSGGSTDYLKDAFTVSGIKSVIYNAAEASNLRDVATVIRDKIGSGIAVITSIEGEKVIVVVTVTKDLVQKFPANKILAPLAELVGGRGGGKPDMAQAGGNNPSGIGQIKETLTRFLENNS